MTCKIAKLHAYSFDMNSIKFTNSNLYDRNERGKINNEYSSCEEIIFGVPREFLDLHSSIFSLMPFLLILDNIEIASSADDNILYCSYSGFEEVISYLERT